MAVLPPERISFEEDGPILTLGVIHNGNNEIQIGIEGSSLRVVRNFVIQGLRGEHPLKPIRELKNLLDRLVHDQGYGEGWTAANEGNEHRTFTDPCYNDGWQAGWTEQQQQGVVE